MSSSSFEFTEEEIREAMLEVLVQNPDKKWEEEELMDTVHDHLVRKTVDDSLERLIEMGYVKKTGVDKETGEDTYTLTKKGEKCYREGEKYYREINKQK